MSTLNLVGTVTHKGPTLAVVNTRHGHINVPLDEHRYNNIEVGDMIGMITDRESMQVTAIFNPLTNRAI